MTLPSTPEPEWECPAQCGAVYPSRAAADACCQDRDDDLYGTEPYWRSHN